MIVSATTDPNNSAYFILTKLKFGCTPYPIWIFDQYRSNQYLCNEPDDYSPVWCIECVGRYIGILRAEVCNQTQGFK